MFRSMRQKGKAVDVSYGVPVSYTHLKVLVFRLKSAVQLYKALKNVLRPVGISTLCLLYTSRCV